MRALSLLIPALLLAPGCAPAAQDGPTPPAVQAELDAIVAELEAGHDRVGILFGRLGPEGSSLDVSGEIAPDDHLRLASLSKMFLAFMVLREGLDPDAPIEPFFPADRHPASETIAVRHLLAHTSGIPDELTLRMQRHGAAFDPDPSASLDALGLSGPAAPPDARIDEVYSHDVDLEFEPGTLWCYSNTGYTMLGRMLERHTSRPIERLLAGHFGAVAPSLRLDDGSETAFPASYVTPWPIHWSQPWIAGGLIATAADALAAFRHIAQQPEFERMQAWTQVPRCEREIVFGDDYGLGLQRYAFAGAGDALGHDGHIIARSLLVQHGDTTVLVHLTRYVSNATLRAIGERLLRQLVSSS